VDTGSRQKKRAKYILGFADVAAAITTGIIASPRAMRHGQ
jgi:hypothetical protein